MKKYMTMFLAIFLAVTLVTGCSGRKKQDSGSEQGNGKQAETEESKTSTKEDSHVLMVKNGCPANYPDSPYGQVFEKYFENPSWSYFQAKNEQGNIVDIVEFTGDCEFENADYKAQIQFTVDVENNFFEATYLAFDGEAQTQKTLQKVLVDAYSKEGPAASGQVGVPAAETTATTAATQATTAAATPAPFYGIWCDAYKKRAAAENQAAEYEKDGIDAYVFVTTDWSNLSPEKWYVISIGVYATQNSANDALDSVREIYPEAYVKYSGDWVGGK